MIRVMIVDDHQLVREGLKTLLEAHEGINVIAEAENGEEALNIIPRNIPDVILMDIKMPKMNGIETTKMITDKWKDIKIIVLTSFVDKVLVEDTLKAGVVGYLMKNIDGDKLVSAIKDAVVGKSSLSSEASNILISNIKKPDYKLTSREKDILALLSKGFSNNEISKKLFISSSTVKFHVSNILMKLGVSSRSKAVSRAVEQNLLDN